MPLKWRRGPQYMSYCGPYLNESLVERAGSPCRLERIATAALEFDYGLRDAEQGDVVKVLVKFLAEHGIHSPEQARARVDVPRASCPIVLDYRVPHTNVTPLSDPTDILRAAVLLGLSTSSRYDPSRPVVWTKRSLERRIVLLDTSLFYSLETLRTESVTRPEAVRVAMGGFYALD